MNSKGISGTLDLGDGYIRNENYCVIGIFFSTQIILPQKNKIRNKV